MQLIFSLPLIFILPPLCWGQAPVWYASTQGSYLIILKVLYLMNFIFCVTNTNWQYFNVLYGSCRPGLVVFRPQQKVCLFIHCGMWIISISLSKQIKSDLNQTISPEEDQKDSKNQIRYVPVSLSNPLLYVSAWLCSNITLKRKVF